MSPQGYEEIDHTADLALKVWGEDFQTLLRQAAMGLYDLMGVKIDPGSLVKRKFSISAGTEETVLVDFLNEVLFLAEEEMLYFEEFCFVEEPHKVLINGAGRTITSMMREVKAVTFHNLAIRKTAEGLETTITFDA